MKARRALSLILPALVFVLAIGVASTALAVTPSHLLSISANGRPFPVPAACVTSGSVDTTGVSIWITKCVAPLVDHKVVKWSSKVDKKHKKLVFSHNDGFSLNQAGSISLICSELAAQVSTPTAKTVVLPANKLAAAKKLGKQLLVVQSQRKIYVYDNDKVIKTFRCAVGQKSWPTPNGTFHIGKKVKNPTWTNGYASWSKNMPSYIGPGVNNPLGTRAMYVYTKTKGGHDTGVRFHGVPHSEDSSIGHAASHGCLRMHRKDVEKLFPMIPLGTAVYIIP
jgi:L,D-transpeptidase ErfK/SrfK